MTPYAQRILHMKTTEFSEEEKLWLMEIASEVPESSELTPLEQHFCDLARPRDELEVCLFELMASEKFGLQPKPIYMKHAKLKMEQDISDTQSPG